MKHALIALLVAATLMLATPAPAQANTASDAAVTVVNAAVDVADQVYDVVVTAGQWTVEKFMAACKAFVACNWTKTRITATVDWMNETCDSFGLCRWSKEQVDRVNVLLGQLCGKAVVCVEAIDWMEEHPGAAVAIELGLAVGIPWSGSLMLSNEAALEAPAVKAAMDVYRTYHTRTGVPFDVPAFARLRGYCKTTCGKYVPKAKQAKPFTNSVKKAALNAACGPKWCEVNGKRFPRSEAHVDHIIPRSCGGASVLKNAQVLHGPENLRKSGCMAPRA